MRYFVGLDISTAETAICIVDCDGNVVKEGAAATEPEAIKAFLRSTGLAFERIGLEAGNLSVWLYWDLLKAGYPVICIDARHASALIGLQTVKTDRNDARGIAHMMRANLFNPVHVRSDESQRLRMLINNRRCLVDQRVVLENQVRGTLKVFGLKTGDVTPRRYDQRVCELIDGDGELEAAILPLLEVRTAIMEKVSVLDRMLVVMAKNDPVCRLLTTVPGVGTLTAVLFKTVIDDPARFSRSKDVAAIIGVTPRKYASGEVDYNGRISKCGDDMLRNHLFEAASIILRPSMRRTPIKAWGLRIAKRSSLKNARVAVARKLAVTMHRMWVDGEEFRWSEATNSEIKNAA
jgi:transposase